MSPSIRPSASLADSGDLARSALHVAVRRDRPIDGDAAIPAILEKVVDYRSTTSPGEGQGAAFRLIAGARPAVDAVDLDPGIASA